MPEGTALEIGVGAGAVAMALMELGRRVVGVDISPEMISQSEAAVVRVVGNAESLPFADGSFLSAYSVAMLHLVDAARVFREAHRVVAPHGHYVVSGSAHAGQPRDALQQIIKRLFDSLLGEPKPDDPEFLARIGLLNGWTLAGVHSGEKSEHTTSVGEWIVRIEAPSFSEAWELAPERREAVVEPLLAELRALPRRDDSLVRVETPVILDFLRS